ncbi:MAG: FHA domain-containing protein [Planctomycetales bacterium]|nr:FHA domain-containing protein [Planctomycetales bacterium]
MQTITLRVISGADRGKVYRELTTPITIGREEGNTVQLNDERISRYHVKIQEDDGRLVITDLDSTNGTRINGHSCSLKILRYGDTISIGRSVLLVGTREQVAEWFAEDHNLSSKDREDLLARLTDDDSSQISESSTGLSLPKPSNSPSVISQIPRGLSPGQAAELRELLDMLHMGIRSVIEHAVVNESEGTTSIDVRAWQSLLMTQSEVAEIIHAIENPSNSLLQNEPGMD